VGESDTGQRQDKRPGQANLGYRSNEGGFSKDAGVGILTCIDVYNLVYISQHFVSQKAS